MRGRRHVTVRCLMQCSAAHDWLQCLLDPKHWPVPPLLPLGADPSWARAPHLVTPHASPALPLAQSKAADPPNTHLLPQVAGTRSMRKRPASCGGRWMETRGSHGTTTRARRSNLRAAAAASDAAGGGTWRFGVCPANWREACGRQAIYARSALLQQPATCTVDDLSPSTVVS